MKLNQHAFFTHRCCHKVDSLIIFLNDYFLTYLKTTTTDIDLFEE